MQLVDPLVLKAGDGRTHRLCTGGDDQPVVAVTAPAGYDGLGGCVDLLDPVLQQELDARVLQLRHASVRQRAPVGDVAGEVVGQPADREVRVGVGQQHRHLHGGVELTRAEGGADPGVAAADDQDAGHSPRTN